MKWKKYKWSVVVIISILTLVILGTSHFLWHHFALETPLYQRVGQLDGVEAVTWDTNDKNESIPTIHITLNKVTNLQKTYQEINDNITNILGEKKYKIVLHDHHTPKLEQLYYAIHYQIQEAIITGKFGIMTQIIQEKALAAHVAAQVYVDGHYIYLQLIDDNDNLYMVIPRQSTSLEVK